MTISRFRTILYTGVAIVAVAGLADATYLTVQALTGETLSCGGSPDCFRVGQFVCQGGRNSGGPDRRAGILHRVYLRHIGSIPLLKGPEIPWSGRRYDVPGHTMAVVRTSVPAACVLPLLLVFRGDYVSYCWTTDCRAVIKN